MWALLDPDLKGATDNNAYSYGATVTPDRQLEAAGYAIALRRRRSVSRLYDVADTYSVPHAAVDRVALYAKHI